MNDLTDLEICKRVAEIEGATETLITNTCKTLTALFHNRTAFNYNPLTDDALCFQLMVKYNIDLQQCLNSYAKPMYWVSQNFVFNYDYTSPNKAICLAIIEAHKGLLS